MAWILNCENSLFGNCSSYGNEKDMDRICLMRASIYLQTNEYTFEMSKIIEENKVNLWILADFAPLLNQLSMQQRSGECEFVLDRGVLYTVSLQKHVLPT